MLVDEFADYRGLTSAPDIANRRLGVKNAIDEEFRNVINPEEVVTWVDLGKLYSRSIP
jgi:hypothetical protein